MISADEKRFKVFEIYCESSDCNFALEPIEPITFQEAQYKLTDMDGAFVGDGQGGSITICPHCKEDSLVIGG